MRISHDFVGTYLGAALFSFAVLPGPQAAAADATEEAWLNAGPVALMASGPDHLELGAGAFEVLDDDTSFQGSLEYRFGSKLAFVAPALGLLANDNGGLYGYLGLYLDVGIGPVRVTPLLAIGGYGEGDGVDLGGVFQFRESLAVTWQFNNGHRLGFKFAHISNANIHDINPGAEDLMVTYALPLGPVF